MSLTFTIDEDVNLVTISGDYATASEWQHLLERLASDPRRRPGCVILRDQRGGTTPVDASTVVAIMKVVRSFWDELSVSRAAILMPRHFDPPALIAEALADDDNMPIRAFLSYQEAMEWLTAAMHDGHQPT